MDGDKQWADPLDCLADLYEMRLDAQADEMVRFLIYKRSSERKRSGNYIYLHRVI